MNRPVRHIIEHIMTEPDTVINFLQERTGLSKKKLKDAMQCGAVWAGKTSAKAVRIRKASARALKGDYVAMYYDEQILTASATEPRCLWSCSEYAIWYKPAGVLSQGSRFGDHLALPRLVQLADPLRKEVYVVHRLDREASGLMLLASSQTAARRLSQLFHHQQIRKQYLIRVKGRPPQSGTISKPLDGKSALTKYQRVDCDEAGQTCQVRVQIKTGRTHQIRRHFALLGFPVMGDPRYGHGNHCSEGLALCAERLEFDCPFSGQHQLFELAELMPAGGPVQA